jgi:hypothetical protein
MRMEPDMFSTPLLYNQTRAYTYMYMNTMQDQWNTIMYA